MNWGKVSAIAAVVALGVTIVAALETRQHWAFEQWKDEHDKVHQGLWCSINPEACAGYGRPRGR